MAWDRIGIRLAHKQGAPVGSEGDQTGGWKSFRNL